ncbi:FmdB family zinc ribbon protein [uncultured Microbacterium sp.]|uniref:FmdB family zinc ribbon protein n=1 Tax=uncultured Microbacterium sp. TaxID=191216 RepID=UPI0025FF0574|nr:FmdB family zinc ribbon protein [uncultured Microbacterium sp.]
MPTYSYACKQCGHRFDAVQSFSDAALTECPSCGGEVRKQYGSIGVTFNGSGFYRTDSRGSSGAAAGGSSPSSTSSKSETKTSAPSSAS